MNSQDELKLNKKIDNLFRNGENINSVQCKVTGKISNY